MPARKYTLITLLWMAALLLSTVGFSVQQIYCYCLGQASFSVFMGAEDACLDASRPGDMFCGNTLLPACCTQDTVKATSASCCNKKSVQFFQLKVEFTVDQAAYKNLNCPIWADELPAFLRLYRPVICEATPTRGTGSGPPPLSGRAICLRHQFFRC